MYLHVCAHRLLTGNAAVLRITFKSKLRSAELRHHQRDLPVEKSQSGDGCTTEHKEDLY